MEMGNEEKEQLLRFSHALRGIEVELLDDIKVGETEYVSLHASGRMDEIRQELIDTILHKYPAKKQANDRQAEQGHMN